jgi:anti-sigma regulatory factor (Ser/Thr protein kinase)
MLPALTDEKSRLKATEAKINDFLVKPVDFFALKLSLKNFLELKRLFREINLSRRFYKTLIDVISDIIVVLDSEGAIVFSNIMGKSWMKKLNVDADNFLKSVTSLYTETESLEALFEESKHGEKDYTEFFFNIQDSYYQLMMIPYHGKTNGDFQIVLVFRDLSLFYQQHTQMASDLEKREKDLKKAMFIQKNLISKKLPLNRKLLIRSLYVPSSSIGGDFHAIYRQGKYIAGFIADVSGHGIEAALYGTILLMAVENHKELIFQDTGRFLTTLDQELTGFNLTYNFITALAFRFDSHKNIMYYANAGHNVPYYVPDGQKEKIPFPIEKGGPPLGLGMGFVFEEHSLDFGRDKFRILFYTDGLVEDFLNESKVSTMEKVDQLLYAPNWLQEIDVFKDELLRREEHPDVDDATVLMMEKRYPIRLKTRVNSIEEVDRIWEKVSALMEEMHYIKEEKNKVFIILQELLSNAVKYGDGASLVMRINPAWILIRVEDRGTGFPVEEYFREEMEEKVEDFLNRKYAEYPRKKSLGMGLLMARHYATKFLYNEKGNVFMTVVKKTSRYTEYCSRYEI